MSKGIKTEKKSVYVLTAWLKEEDEEGNPLNWSIPSETYYADTYEQAQQLKEKLMSGLDEYYGDLIEDCWISDEKEEVEFIVPAGQPSVVRGEQQIFDKKVQNLQMASEGEKEVEQRKRTSVLNNLYKKQEQIKVTETVKEEPTAESHRYEKYERGGER